MRRILLLTCIAFWNMNKSIVIVYSNLGLGGIPVRIIDIINELSITHPGVLIYVLLKEERGFDLRSEINNPNAQVHDYWKSCKYDNACLFMLWTWWQIFIIKPKIIISFISPYGLTALFTKILFFWRENTIVIDEGHYTSTMVNSMILPGIQKLGIRLLYPRADTLIVPTKAVKNDLRNSFGIPKDIIHIIPNWTKHAGKPLMRRRRRVDLISIGRFESKKNVLPLLSLIREIVLNHRPDLSCVFVGEGSLKNAMHRYVTDHRLEKNITILPPAKDVFPFLADAKIFVLHSDRSAEGFPVSILDAMAAGAIVVSTQFLGGREVINHANGYLVENESKMKRTIVNILAHYSAQRLRQSCAKRVVTSRFSKKQLHEFIRTFQL